MKKDIKVAAAAGLSVYLPLYWMFTLPEVCDTSALTAGEAAVLLLVLAAYLSAPSLLRLLSYLRLSGSPPAWLSISTCGAAVLVLADAAFGISRQAGTMDGAVKEWVVLSAWAMPASAGVYYFGAVVRRIEGWHRGPDHDALSLRR